jgi:hypothetical protein
MSSIGRVGARKRQRLIARIAVDWLPPSWGPSGACLGRGARVACRRITPTRTAPHRGCGSSHRRAKPGANGVWACKRLGLGRQWSLLGNSPHKCPQFPGNSNAFLRGAFLWCSAAESVCTGGAAPSNCYPGGVWPSSQGAGGDGDCPWPATGTPRRLRPGPGGHAYSRSW